MRSWFGEIECLWWCLVGCASCKGMNLRSGKCKQADKTSMSSTEHHHIATLNSFFYYFFLPYYNLFDFVNANEERKHKTHGGPEEDRADVWTRLYKQNIFPPMQIYLRKHTNQKPMLNKTEKNWRGKYEGGGAETLDQTTNIVFDGRTNNVPSLWSFDYNGDDNVHVNTMFIWITSMIQILDWFSLWSSSSWGWWLAVPEIWSRRSSFLCTFLTQALFFQNEAHPHFLLVLRKGIKT